MNTENIAFKDGLQAGIRVSAAPETIIGGGWIIEAVEQSASFSQIRDGDILVKVNDKACIRYRYHRKQDMLSARSLANITLEGSSVQLKLVPTLQSIIRLRGCHQLTHQQQWLLL